jgi:hypothetical protein
MGKYVLEKAPVRKVAMVYDRGNDLKDGKFVQADR